MLHRGMQVKRAIVCQHRGSGSDLRPARISLSRYPPSESNLPLACDRPLGTVIAIWPAVDARKHDGKLLSEHSENACAGVSQVVNGRKLGVFRRVGGWDGLAWSNLRHTIFFISASGAAQHGLADHETSAHAWARRMPQRLGWVFRLAHPGRGIFSEAGGHRSDRILDSRLACELT